MAIPLSEVIKGDNSSMREQASDNNLPYEPFTMRELITPQYQVNVSSSPETWENWIGQHENGRIELRPTNRKQLIASVVQKAHSNEDVRAVGSGHSHSAAPAPRGTYINLNPQGPGESGSAGLNDTLNHKGWLNGGVDEEHHKRLESGIILRRLNRYLLHDNGYALKNMGSYDGQTIAGAVNTSTHGTGIGLKSVSDSVASVEIATVPESASGDPIVRMYRIEPTNGITNRDDFEAETGTHEMELIQDDEIFHSVVVGYGCMGVVYAYTMEVVDTYWLAERTSIMDWNTLESKLGTTKQSVKNFLTKNGTRHCQIFINTAAEQVKNNDSRLRQHESHGVGKHEDWRNPVCLVKRHIGKFTGDAIPDKPEGNGKVSKPNAWEKFNPDDRWPPERRNKAFRDWVKNTAELHPLKPNNDKAKKVHNNFFHPAINREPFRKNWKSSVWYVALRRLQDTGDTGTSNYWHPATPSPPTSTTEIGVAVEDVVEAINAFRKKVRNVKQGGQIPGDEKTATAEGRDVFFPVPMGIRFTADSGHFLSPEYDRETAMVELPLPIPEEGDTAGAKVRPNVPDLDHDEMREWVVEPALTEVEQHMRNNALTHVNPRPHMGKHNTVDADWLDSNYDYFDASDTSKDVGWYQAYQRFNHFGTFDNAFTDQLGLDSYQSGGSSDDSDEEVQGTSAPPTTSQGTTQPPGTAPPEPSPAGTEPADDEDGGGSSMFGPGFGVGAGLAGVGLGGWWLSRKTAQENGADGDSGMAEEGDPAGSDPAEPQTDPAETQTDDADSGDGQSRDRDVDSTDGPVGDDHRDNTADQVEDE